MYTVNLSLFWSVRDNVHALHLSHESLISRLVSAQRHTQDTPRLELSTLQLCARVSAPVSGYKAVLVTLVVYGFRF